MIVVYVYFFSKSCAVSKNEIVLIRNLFRINLSNSSNCEISPYVQLFSFIIDLHKGQHNSWLTCRYIPIEANFLLDLYYLSVWLELRAAPPYFPKKRKAKREFSDNETKRLFCGGTETQIKRLKNLFSSYLIWQFIVGRHFKDKLQLNGFCKWWKGDPRRVIPYALVSLKMVVLSILTKLKDFVVWSWTYLWAFWFLLVRCKGSLTTILIDLWHWKYISWNVRVVVVLEKLFMSW